MQFGGGPRRDALIVLLGQGEYGGLVAVTEVDVTRGVGEDPPVTAQDAEEGADRDKGVLPCRSGRHSRDRTLDVRAGDLAQVLVVPGPGQQQRALREYSTIFRYLEEQSGGVRRPSCPTSALVAGGSPGRDPQRTCGSSCKRRPRRRRNAPRSAPIDLLSHRPRRHVGGCSPLFSTRQSSSVRRCG